MRHVALHLVALTLALPAGAASAQPPTLEDRVRRLEADVARLNNPSPIRLAGSPTAPDAGSVHLRFGNPGGTCTLLEKEFFVACHDGTLRVPAWVGYHVTSADLTSEVERARTWRAEQDVPEGERALDANYAGQTAYDRGHLAPAADFARSEAAMRSTFVFSNAAPQVRNMNRGRWKQLEAAVRQVGRTHGDIWVFTGVLFLDARRQPPVPVPLLRSRVGIPGWFYKVVLCRHPGGGHEMFAYLMPNRRITEHLDSFLVSVDEIEALTGLNFFSQLSPEEERRLEAQRNSIRP